MEIRLRKVKGKMCHELILTGPDKQTIQIIFAGDSKDFKDSMSDVLRMQDLLKEYILRAQDNWEKARDFKEDGLKNESFNQYYEKEEDIDKIFSEIKEDE